MNDYYNTKLKLFTDYKSKRKIICIDCYYGKKIINYLKVKIILEQYHIVDNKADFYASNIIYSEKGISFIINSKYGKRKIITNLYGEFSIINILLSIATLAKNKRIQVLCR
jgi:UDP-N-acetylmuramoyl-L-alanyl-D-glutamate--2,6-diaminopimelate ligase